MTGKLAVDISSAGNIGGIYDINTHKWSYEMMHELGVPYEMMPDNLVECSDVEAPLCDAELAALGAGLISDPKLVREWATLEFKTSPNSENKNLYDELFNIYKDLYKNTRNEMKRLKMTIK